MKRILFALVAITILSTVFAPVVHAKDVVSKRVRKIIGKDAYVLTKKEFPELYDVAADPENSPYAILGYPTSLKSWSLNMGSEYIYYIKQKEENTTHVAAETYNTLVYYTLMKGDLKKAEELIKMGADLNETESYGNNMLHVLLEKRKEAKDISGAIALLLKMGADPNSRNGDDETALNIVLREDDKDSSNMAMIKSLMKAGADPNAGTRDVVSKRVRKIIGKDAYVLTKKEFPELYDVAADPENSPYAILGYPTSLKSWSLNMGSEYIYYIKQREENTTHVAAETYNTLVYYTLMKGDLKKAEELIKMGADLNETESYGNNMLHVLLEKRKEAKDISGAIALLLKMGADPNSRNGDDETALNIVLREDDKDGSNMAMMETLLKAGADPNAGTRALPLHTVLGSDMKDKSAALRKLIKHGVDPNMKDEKGNTSVHEAVMYMYEDREGTEEETVIGWLDIMINRKTPLDARNARGKTALAYAYFGDYDKIARHLIAKGATDYGIKNESYEFKAENGVSVHGLGSGEISNLKAEKCGFILKEYDVEFESLTNIKNVEIPIRINSPIGGIKFSHTHGSEKYSIMDCRLAVALVGWAPILREHNVREVRHMRAYSPDAKVGGGTQASMHSFALAIDASHFVLEDGTEFEVLRDWSDRRPRADFCNDSPKGEKKAQRMLKELACETGEIDLFTIILTPHYNKAHYDHLHLDLSQGQYSYMK
ncbi:extensin family protein [Nitrospirota bacterium]